MLLLLLRRFIPIIGSVEGPSLIKPFVIHRRHPLDSLVVVLGSVLLSKSFVRLGSGQRRRSEYRRLLLIV